MPRQRRGYGPYKWPLRIRMRYTYTRQARARVPTPQNGKNVIRKRKIKHTRDDMEKQIYRTNTNNTRRIIEIRMCTRTHATSRDGGFARRPPSPPEPCLVFP